jgi:N-methylhydantoinase A
VAAALGMARVVVPLHAAVLSAWGMLNTDPRVVMMRSLPQGGAMDVAALAAACAAMEQEGRARLAWCGGKLEAQFSADMRYGKQVSEIAVPLDGMDLSAPDIGARLADAFHRRHEALFSYALRDRMPVLVNARVSVSGCLPGLPAMAVIAESDPGAHRRIHLDGWREVPVHRFAGLPAGAGIVGPAVIDGEATTVLLRDGDRAVLDARGWLDVAVAATTPLRR